MTTHFTIDPLPLNSSDDEHYYTLTCDTGNPDKLPLKFVYDLQGLRDLKATLDAFFHQKHLDETTALEFLGELGRQEGCEQCLDEEVETSGSVNLLGEDW